jgi:hypothetical protein
MDRDEANVVILRFWMGGGSLLFWEVVERGVVRIEFPFASLIRKAGNHVIHFNVFDGLEVSAAASPRYIVLPTPAPAISFLSNLDWRIIAQSSLFFFPLLCCIRTN